MRSCFLLLFLFLLHLGSGAANLDSLLAIAASKKEADTTRLIAYQRIIEKCEQSQYLMYTEPAIKLAEQCANTVSKEDPLYSSYRYMLGFFYYHKAYALERKGEIPAALELYAQALKIFEEIKNMDALGGIYNNLGAIYESQGDYPKARANYDNALKIYRELKSEKAEATIYLNIGKLYFVEGDEKKAKESYEQSLRIRERIGDKIGLGYTLNNIGALYYNKFDYVNAIKYLNDALRVRREANHKEGIAETTHNIACIYFRKNDLNQAESFAKQAMEIGKEIGYPNNIRDASKLLYDIFLKRGDHKAALEMYKEYITMRDSINNERNYKASAQMQAQMQYNFDKKEAAARIEKEKSEKLMLYGGLALVLVFSGFLFNRILVTRRQKRIIEMQKSQAEASLTEKEALLKEIHHRVKNNLQVISGILELQAYGTTNTDVKEIVMEGQNRVKSIALIHQKLYQSENIASIPFEDYLLDLTKTISATVKHKNEVVVNIEAKNLHFDVDTAVPLGLIVNELVTNAYKHAFEDTKPGNIHIHIANLESENFVLTLRDNGKGMPADHDINTSASLGLQLVKGLARQLKGKFEFTSNNGAEFRVYFRNNVYSKS